MLENTRIGVRIAGRAFDLQAEKIVRAMAKVEPEPIARHYIVIGPRRFPRSR